LGNGKYMRKLSSEKARLVNERIDRLRTLHRRPVCLAEGTCEGVIGRSHTISKSQSLSFIAENEHLLVRQVNLFAGSQNNVLDIKLTGINEALSFPGFCNKHDNDLFQSLDTLPFMATPEQLFMQAYRCACREYYFKSCQVEAFLDAKEIAELQGLPKDKEYKLSPQFEIIKASMTQGLADAVASKNKFETRLAHGEYWRMRSYIIHSSSSPVFACAGGFSPDYLSNGETLQDFTDFNASLEQLYVSVIPDQTGIFVVLSFFDDGSMAPTRFIEDLVASSNLATRVAWMCMTRLENLAMKPSWWKSLPEATREKINDAVHYNADVFDSRLPTFDEMPDLEIDEWVICHKFWI